MAWTMTFCQDSFSSKPLVEKTFENLKDGIDWLRQYAPGLLHPETWKSLEAEDWKQYGTDNHWATFKRKGP